MQEILIASKYTQLQSMGRAYLVGEILPCIQCKVNVGVSRAVMRKFPDGKLPPVMCKECVQSNDKIQIANVADPSPEEIKIIRQYKPDFDENDLRRLKDNVKNKRGF